MILTSQKQPIISTQKNIINNLNSNTHRQNSNVNTNNVRLNNIRGIKK